ncbi:unnamed protein product [Cuscuta epithymum]|uniref:Uncharacterized protein n=1 Tax=Cuscuta epithymum TaxID=186058 RepID=A0AAV0FQW6_9ASTE|nr:unnamed protein product [Cuscuta epithymum]CAH9138048.1 unnamed protein product [Cuscuta epithymum]
MTTLSSSVKWILKDHKGSKIKGKAVRIAFCAAVYYLWHARNANRFDEGDVKEDEVVAKIKHVVYKILFNIYPHDLITFSVEGRSMDIMDAAVWTDCYMSVFGCRGMDILDAEAWTALVIVAWASWIPRH